MKKILMISYLFPPLGGSGVQRVLKFVKYLPRFGWQPTILTPRNPDCETSDPALLKEVRDQIEVIRTHTIEPSPIGRFLISLVDKMRSVLRTRQLTTKADFDGTPTHRLHTKISNFIFIPDKAVGWMPFAFSALLRSRERHKFDMIFSTSPPFSVHLVGLIAKFVLKKPWVVDFRDLWIQNPRTSPPSKVHFRISSHIERTVLKHADRILTVSEPLCDDLKEAYPDIIPEKFQVIPNGYDADDLKVGEVEQNEKLSFGHVGTLHWFYGRTPYYFLTAMAELKKEVPQLVKEMSVLFVGATDPLNKKTSENMISRWDLKDTVRLIDFLPHGQAISYMKSLSVLLFIPARSYKGGGSSRGNFSGKLYEYLATGKPILALTEEKPIRDFIEKTGCGILVDYDDTREIKERILDCYNKFKQGRLEVKPNWDFISRFERKKLTGQLAKILDDLSEKALK